MEALDVNRIREILPHRYPFLLIDRIVEHDDENLRAIKNVTINEPFFEGHYPHMPVMPGVLILEVLAQASACLVSLSLDASATTERVYLFAGADKIRFRKPVVPGDVLHVHSRLIRRVKQIWKCETVATVDDTKVCSAELMFTYRDI